MLFKLYKRPEILAVLVGMGSVVFTWAAPKFKSDVPVGFGETTDPFFYLVAVAMFVMLYGFVGLLLFFLRSHYESKTKIIWMFMFLAVPPLTAIAFIYWRINGRQA
ncbi:MAG: hypothetical protein AB8G18_17695 [Gammaproteobacteria bacterium]